MKKRNEMKGYFYDAAQIVLVFAVYSILIFALVFGLMDISEWVRDAIRLRNSEMPPAEVDYNAGIGRLELSDVQIYAAGSENETKETSLYEFEVYREGDSPVPVWYKPYEPMSAAWEAPAEVSETVGVGSKASPAVASNAAPVAPVKDIASPDWNLNTSLVGWDGHLMEKWEFELFVRITYLEFWGTSKECCEAGIDSMLLLWDMGEYGRTMGELLSAQYAPGKYVYSPYAYVWDWTYNAEGLAYIRTMCEERFESGPIWCAPYFRLWYYHPWAIPAYEIDGVYFSIPKAN